MTTKRIVMKYYLDKDNKLTHWEGCAHYVNRASQIFLGWFKEDLRALKEGRKITPDAQGCSWCMNEVSDIPPSPPIPTPTSRKYKKPKPRIRYDVSWLARGGR